MSKRTDNKNYELKSKAVETLANADKVAAPQYSEEELNKYRSRKGIHIPETAKVLFIKAWFAGAVCYFILWGLGMYLNSLVDMIFVMGIVLGLVTDLMANNVIRFIEKTPGENDKWLMFSKKGMASFFLNMIYSLVILVCVYGFYGFINNLIVRIIGNADTVPVGVEPILFGVFCMAFDLLFLQCKQLLHRIISDAREKSLNTK